MADLFVIERAGGSSETEPTPPSDWKQRERALDVQQSWIVEAPAGSGKTGLLIQRYLKLLASPSVEEPEQVLAITFTVKATAEMRDRVIAQLEAAERADEVDVTSDFHRVTRELANAVLQRDQLLGWGLLDRPRRLRIRTIDSVCGEIVRLLPVLSGGGGRLTPVDDPTPMYRDAAQQTLRQLGGADAELDHALRTILLHRDGSLADCERLLMEMLPARNQWGALVPVLGRETMTEEFLDREVLPRLQGTLDAIICTGLKEFSQSVPADFLDALAALASSLADLTPYQSETSPIAVCASKPGVPSTDVTDLAHWRALIHLLVTPSTGTWRKLLAKHTLGFEITPLQKKEIKALLEQVAHRDDLLRSIERVNRLPPALYPPEQWDVAKALFRVLSRAMAELKIIFVQSGECDFAEWELLSQAALRQEGVIDDLNAAFGIELQHLLVDEMQDTSASQYQLIQLLTQEWDGHSQTVFLVGDPKQSIYLFRQARVERFVRTMQTQRLGELPLGCLQLTANFRSQGGLVSAFNRDFCLLFPRVGNAASPEEVPYIEAHAVRPASRHSEQSTVWHTQVLAPETLSHKRARKRRNQSKAQARQVRQIIEDWRARVLPEGRTDPWKIAVLVRSRNLLPDIIEELKDTTRGAIPFRAVDIELLGERQEVLDLFALTRALLHPADRVAWFATLHAPWCGLGLADLHTLAGSDDPVWAERSVQNLIAERSHLLIEDSYTRLMRVWTVLQAAEQHRSDLTTAQWVERTWRSLGGEVYLKSEELTNARRYFQLLDEVEQQTGAVEVQLLHRRLGKLFAQAATGPGMVDVMTIHGAKGLEWDVVMIPGLEKRAPATREKLLSWTEIDSGDEHAAHIMLAPILGRGEASRDLNDWLKSIDRTREAAERKRLFYVACTRAREEVHLFTAPEATSKGEIHPAPGSLLSTAWPIAQTHFIAATPMSAGGDPSPPLANMLIMSLPDLDATGHGKLVVDLAAGEEDQEEERIRPAILKRLPIEFDPAAQFASSREVENIASSAIAGNFDRPTGSFEARALGNVVHAFLEMLAQQLTREDDRHKLQRDVRGWSARIAALLRAHGMPPASLERLARQVQTALLKTLQDETGLWLLGARAEASSELALTAWNDAFVRVRIDRVFRGGERPLSAGEDYLWIVDYKTATHGREGMEEFLQKERETYSAQLQRYAALMRSRVPAGHLRVGLYYAMLQELIWWEL